jgi:hypothetical protein
VPGRSSSPGRAAGQPLNAEDVERLLTELPDLEVVGLLQGASNYTFLAQLGPHPPSGIAVVYKPARGESPLWDFEAGTLYRREVAAYQLSKALGWPRIPPTVVRESGPHGVGALQLFVEADRRHFLSQQAVQRDTWLQIALFDVIANNADRKAGHILKDRAGKLWGIDHGLTFNTAPKLRTIIWDWQSEPIPGPLRHQLDAFRRDPKRVSDLRQELEALLDRAEVETFFKRLEQTVSRGCYPPMHSRRAVPWPWY